MTDNSMIDDTETDDVDSSTTTGTDGAGSDNHGQTDDDWKPPSRDEWTKVQRALAKVTGEAKTRREQLAELRGKTEGDAEKAAREQTEAAEKRYKPIAIRAAAKAAFLEAGLQGTTPERVAKLVRMLDLDGITIDDTGEVSGLDEQVSMVKADYPELFTPIEKKVTRLNTGDRTGGKQQPKRTADLIAAQALGG